MTRIKQLSNFISPCKYVIDVGSDHSYLAIRILRKNFALKVVNVEINEKPLQQGIINLKKYNLYDKTINILNDGLKNIETKIDINNFDYCIISGMGSNSIIDILQNNTLNIKNFILQSNRDNYSLRKWLLKNKYKIIKEEICFENNIYYTIILAEKNKGIFTPNYSMEELYFGKLNLITNIDVYQDYLKHYKHFLDEISSKNNNIAIKFKDELSSLKKRISR